jgi:putative ATP-dependent endonuclease of OLD family
MRLASVHARNYRCLNEIDIDIDSLTSLIGMNGSGKSALLRLVAAFYSQGDLLVHEDWYGGATDQEIEVSLTFMDLTEAERQDFKRYVSTEGSMKVARIWHLEDGRVREALHGYHFACPEFSAVRDAVKGVAQLHNTLVATGQFVGLAKVTKQDDVEGALQVWEAEHPERCEWIRDSGKFFGWGQVGGARLATATTCVYVPAVRDARDDASQTRGSVLTQIVELVLKSELERNPDLVTLQEETQGRFEEILRATRPTLQTLASELSLLMEEYAPGSGVVLDWRSDAAAIPEWPAIEARLHEDGVETPVWAKGHGLQRSFVVSLLQRLAEARSQPVDGTDRPLTILLIEEPELYQHPLAIKRFARVLRRLSSEEQHVQVIYSTHAAEFVGFDHFDSIRRFQKQPQPDGRPPATEVNSLGLTEVAAQFVATWDLDPEVVTLESTRHRIRTVMAGQVSEGFFARGLVLVEGGQDVAMLEGIAARRGVRLEDKGVAIVPVGGKGNLDRAQIVFSGFGIPSYVVWDGDASRTTQREASARQNRALARLSSLTESDFPPTTVGPNGTVFADRLETEIGSALAGRLEELAERASATVGLPLSRDLLKTTYGCEAFLACLDEEDLHVPVLEELIGTLDRTFS